MKKRRNKKVSKSEKFIYKTFGFLAIILVIGTVFSQVMLSKINLEVEKLKEELAYQEDINQGLDEKIKEIASQENINAISESLGLTYNNENIKTITG